ncbi:16S rRNA (cytidine(1402)-2'-O)-methyltransferase [Desulfurobacterium indicum]|uniref:Ribosomal RNA small subunit methyltransferase I n=1 Tax=Desulfurobacterium indicum TaxID=1914305 RepID=A0A1R1MK33_9BACT|nr:16S rRNA (cytidine(1402)-2'-O)-methyltransferase [Desulfurobacterium indicum]OMH40123.1 16S rRNA (cytidine(1402)-2'-O)-methyltransferase [Desulfurobacterium indicum]
MEGTLYIVATPIGNLKDITLRALETFKTADIIAAEDTRRTKELLSAFNITGKKLISCHEHNEKEAADKIISLLKEGKNICLVSDAGTPAISDPGFRVIKKAREENIRVVPIPGTSAVIAALSGSGFPSDKFLFYGFLPKKKKKRDEALTEIIKMPWTVVAYESPHRIEETLKAIHNLNPEKKIAIYREITKLHEEFLTGTAEEILKRLTPKGEMVILFYPQREDTVKIEPEKLLKKFKEEGKTLKEAVKKTCQITGLRKNEIYKKALKIFSE